jgi:hypothetical protein
MTVSVLKQGRGGTLAVRIDGVASAAAGGQGSILNPWDVDVLILRSTLVVHTASTGAANIDIGVASAAATDATDIINALAMNGVSAQTAYNGHAMQNTAKTAISAPALWQDDYYVTITGSASLVGLEATLYLECIPVDEPAAGDY